MGLPTHAVWHSVAYPTYIQTPPSLLKGWSSGTAPSVRSKLRFGRKLHQKSSLDTHNISCTGVPVARVVSNSRTYVPSTRIRGHFLESLCSMAPKVTIPTLHSNHILTNHFLFNLT